MADTHQLKIAIVGAGAAGCFAAANIPYLQNREVVVFEKTGAPMKKVKVSGGGRCNVTHHCSDMDELLSAYPRGRNFLKKAFHQFAPKDTVHWFESRGVPLKTEADGRMFPTTDSSQSIIDCIWQELCRNNAQVRYHKSMRAILPLPGGQWQLVFEDASTYTADRILVTAGGLTKPEQYAWATALGHTIEPPVPSLFTFNVPGNSITSLMGIAVPQAAIAITGTKLFSEGPILITHWGFSGPAVLRLSAFAARQIADAAYRIGIQINWLHQATEAGIAETIQSTRASHGGSAMVARCPFLLPKRLWEFLTARCGIRDTDRWGDLTASGRSKLIGALIRDPYMVHGKTTFKEEFVTCGGIRLAETDPHTLQSRKAPGIFFAGEVLDIDGITGGYNFQNAWTTGWIAAKNVAE